MSIYQINKILYLTDNDADLRKRITEDPEGAVNTFRLSEEERDALTSGAVGKLYRMGVHTFLLNHLSRYEFSGEHKQLSVTDTLGHGVRRTIRAGPDADSIFRQGK